MRIVSIGRAVVSFIDLVKHPEHLGRVFELADSLEGFRPDGLREVRDFFAKDPTGARALRDKPRIGKVDLAALGKLPEGTLGRVFADHMTRNNLDPSAIPVRNASDELEYLRAHLFETHDVWHAMTGFGPSVADEAGLQAFYLAQFPARLGAAILALAFLNTLLYAFDERDARMRALVRGWLLGKRAKPFFGVDWKAHWATPIAEVRRELGVDIAGVEGALPDVDAAEVVRAAA